MYSNVFSETSDLVEHCVDPGEKVKIIQVIAEFYNIERSSSPSQEYYACMDGSYSGRYFSGLITPGLPWCYRSSDIESKLNRLLRRL